MTGPDLLALPIPFLPTSFALASEWKKLTVCLVQFWALSTPEKQVQSSAQELDVKTEYFSAGHLFF